ncbi:hypothetical protein [Qipengyuania sp. YIM B01966]|uniref:hypothetical protein n=1 Tax=Qipengyuania sp. YIM B01966 TaxID=2778646 RepID=UPI0018F754D3|nr:hypothetical protein [Qipengyuania sp. YIM B01966]
MSGDELTPRFQRESDLLLRQATAFADDEGFPIVYVSRLNLKFVRSSFDQIASHWEAQGWGKQVVENDGYGDTFIWSFSDDGLKAGRRRLRKEKWRKYWGTIGQNWIAFAALLASLIAAVAAVFSAYFSFLGLKH